MSKEQEKVTKPTSNKKTPFATKHETPIIIQLPKYNLFIAIKTNINSVQIGLDEKGEVILNKIPNKDGVHEPRFVGINSHSSVTILTTDEVKDHMSIYQHD